MEPSAEFTYLFRHALLRDAAYQLQLPSARAKLHLLAFHLIEDAFGGRAPTPEPLASSSDTVLPPHKTDSAVDELLHHLETARMCDEGLASECLDLLRLYLHRGGIVAARRGDQRQALPCWLNLAELLVGDNQVEALRNAASAAQTLGQTVLTERLISRAESSLSPEASHWTRCRLENSKGRFLMHTGNAWQAEVHFQSALRIAETCSNDRLTILSILNLAGLYWLTGRIHEAEAYYRRTLVLCVQLGAQRNEATTKANLGAMLQQTGRTEEAALLLEQALELARLLGERRMEGAILGNLGLLHLECSRLGEAERYLTEALPAHQETGDCANEATTLSNLGLLAERHRNPEAAKRYFHRALALYSESADSRGQGIVLSHLASLHLDLGATERAIQLAVQALTLHEHVGNKPWIATTLGNLARMLHLAGKPQEARERYTQAIALAGEYRMPQSEGGHMCNFALLQLEEGKPDSARQTWRTGYEILLRAGAKSQIASATTLMRKACAKAKITPFDDGLTSPVPA
ncbi:MAG: tetratricopeptide repeat protein [Planctomycetes bacterium]|nr:tetratricopeptide repeat protein [Planctomycetota bacterium]